MEMCVHIMQSIHLIKLENCTFIVNKSSVLYISVYYSDDRAAN